RPSRPGLREDGHLVRVAVPGSHSDARRAISRRPLVCTRGQGRAVAALTGPCSTKRRHPPPSGLLPVLATRSLALSRAGQVRRQIRTIRKKTGRRLVAGGYANNANCTTAFASLQSSGSCEGTDQLAAQTEGEDGGGHPSIPFPQFALFARGTAGKHLASPSPSPLRVRLLLPDLFPQSSKVLCRQPHFRPEGRVAVVLQADA